MKTVIDGQLWMEAGKLFQSEIVLGKKEYRYAEVLADVYMRNTKILTDDCCFSQVWYD